MTDTQSANIKALQDRLTGFKVFISGRDEQGLFTVWTRQEPLFCFQRETLEEATTVIEDTILSYIGLFHNVEGIKVVFAQPLISPPAKVAKLSAFSHLIPSFSGAFNKELSLAIG
jgi:hypothetical protein